jgi:alkylation response protein AidB-like acyl-CoA dehydrogenase
VLVAAATWRWACGRRVPGRTGKPDKTPHTAFMRMRVADDAACDNGVALTTLCASVTYAKRRKRSLRAFCARALRASRRR